MKKLGLLVDNEKIILAQTDFKKSGNFITNVRLSTFWKDGAQKNFEISSANYTEIDTLILVDYSKSLTYKSYIKVVKKDSSTFNLYFEGKTQKTKLFLDTAFLEWKKNQKISVNYYFSNIGSENTSNVANQ